MYVWDFAALKPYWPLIWQGLMVTVFYTVITVVTGLNRRIASKTPSGSWVLAVSKTTRW